MRSNRRVLSVVAAAAVVAASSTVLDARSALSTQGWSVYKNERYGYRLSYPGGLFNPAETPNKESGAIWTTAEGARLIATAAPNESGETLQSYKDFVMRESYAGARIDYSPTKDDWFVVSGQQGDQMFYERITFACDGRYIYGWQMRYPVSQRRKYDLIVEAIHASFKAGRGVGGNCEPPPS